MQISERRIVMLNSKNKNKIDNEIKPWERQPNEPIMLFEAFVRYRDMGRERTIAKVALELNRSRKMLAPHSAKWKWGDRTKAWIDELDRIKRETTIREIQEMAKRHAQQAMIHQRITMIPAEMLTKKLQNKEESDKFNKMTTDKLYALALDAANTFTKVVDVERKSRGEATEISKQDITSAGETIKVILPPPPPIKNEDE